MRIKGFTLIEVLLSVFIITVAVLGLYNGISYAFNSIEKAKDQFIAAYLAEEGVEIVKNLRDSNFVASKNWKEGLGSCTNGCRADYKSTSLETNTPDKKLLINDHGYYNYTEGDETPFSRKITITDEGTDKIRVEAEVLYGDHKFLLRRYLYNWK
ncbi:MAG: prepilin-type N-terminal cleavage/methylation domain-containing protein [Candidatus Paceibacterota bacterium]